MTSRLAALSLDAADPDTLARFWSAVLGWQEIERDDTGVSIGDPGGGLTMDLLLTYDPKAVKNRLHLDVRADAGTTEQELARLESLGAVRVDVGQPVDVSWTVLVDPEGNEFCLLSGTAQAAAAKPGSSPS